MRRGALRLFLSTLWLLALASGQSAESTVESIDIHFRWGGLLGTWDESYQLKRDGASFVLRGQTRDAELVDGPEVGVVGPVVIDDPAVAMVEKALLSPPLNKADGIAQLTSPEWLAA